MPSTLQPRHAPASAAAIALRDVRKVHGRGDRAVVALAIAATALLPLTHALTGTLRPYLLAAPLAAIVGTSALLAFLAMALPTRRVLRSRPVEAIGVGD